MAAYNAYSREIDNDMLIEEVRVRPALYDRSVKEYNDLAFKKAMWEEISLKLFPDTWHEMSETQRDVRGTEVLKRWNNLRTCFSRELKIMKDPLQNKRRKYIYFDKLLFLIDENSQQYQDIDTTIIFTKSDSSLDKFEDESTPFSEKSLPSDKKTKEINKKSKAQKSKLKEERKKNVEKYVQYSINKLKEELAYKNRSEDCIHVESVPKTFDTNADTNFALSLVPMLKLVPLEKKIDAQIDILNVLKKYTSKISFEYNIVKFEKEDEQTSEADDGSEILSLYGDDK